MTDMHLHKVGAYKYIVVSGEFQSVLIQESAQGLGGAAKVE